MNLYEVRYDGKDEACTYVVAHTLEEAWDRFRGLYKPTDQPPVQPSVRQVNVTGKNVILFSQKVVQELQAKEDKKCP